MVLASTDLVNPIADPWLPETWMWFTWSWGKTVQLQLYHCWVQVQNFMVFGLYQPGPDVLLWPLHLWCPLCSIQ